VGDWTYINGLFQSAFDLYQALQPQTYVSISATLVSNEVSGAVTYGAGQLIYQPGQIVIVPPLGKFGRGFGYFVPASFSGPVQIEATPIQRLLNTNSNGYQPFNYEQPLDQIALVIMQGELVGEPGSANITPAWQQSGSSQPQNLASVDALANVIYGAGPGVTDGENALYAISLNGQPQVSYILT
jgi:hypothetical protein